MVDKIKPVLDEGDFKDCFSKDRHTEAFTRAIELMLRKGGSYYIETCPSGLGHGVSIEVDLEEKTATAQIIPTPRYKLPS